MVAAATVQQALPSWGLDPMISAICRSTTVSVTLRARAAKFT